MTVACSVLYRPFSEMDLDEPYGAPPESAYYDRADRAARRDRARHRGRRPRRRALARRTSSARAQEKIAFVHCVEGGFHLGASPTRSPSTSASWRARGVLYITLAHLFWRRVATNAPALPFLPDALYNLLFPQKDVPGLSPLGEAAVRAMHETGVLVDISHMREDAIDGDVQARRGARPRGGADPTPTGDRLPRRLPLRRAALQPDRRDDRADRRARRRDRADPRPAPAQRRRPPDGHEARSRSRWTCSTATSTRSAPTTSRSAPTSTASSSRRSAASSRRRTSRRSRTRCARATRVGGPDPERERAAGDRAAIRSTLTPRISRQVSPPRVHDAQQHASRTPGSAAPSPCPRRRSRSRPGRSRRSRRRSRPRS